MKDSQLSPPVVEPEGSSRIVLGAVLCLVYLLVRGQGLLAFPLFSDEAIYLRWGQLAATGGGGHGWVSLIDPKPPLHFWMLAAVWGWTKDPLLAGRGLSVFAGMVSIPALLLVCDEIGQLQQISASVKRFPLMPSGRIVGLLAVVLMIFCPFLAFYQRLAMADAVFVAEILLAVWLGLQWSRRVISGQRAWPTAIALGIVMGAAMMTRQGLSYTLWGIPAAGLMLHYSSRISVKRWAVVVSQGILAAAIAGVLWLPYLTHDLARYTAEARAEAAVNAGDISPLSIVKQRIVYQDKFTQSQMPVVSRAIRNSGWTGEWFLTYMTWPVCAAAVLGIGGLALRRQWRMVSLLLWWLALMLGPIILLGNVVYSRYVLAGAPVVLIAAAYFVAEVLGLVLSTRVSPVITWSAAGAMLVAVLLLPLRQVALQATAWWQQDFTQTDRAQYVTGWTNGLATQKALKFIAGYAASGGKVVLITDNGWGLPADAAWVYLEHLPNLEIYYKTGATDSPLLTPAPEGGGGGEHFLLRKDKWLYTPEQAVEISPEASVLFLTECRGSEEALLRSLREFTPNLKPVLSFYGIDKGAGEGGEHVVLFEVQ
jgi:4-amino-4-deoxy-L-arabinose transferase-like glycosyltransferase